MYYRINLIIKYICYCFIYQEFIKQTASLIFYLFDVISCKLQFVYAYLGNQVYP